MTGLDLILPLRIKRLEESIGIVDAAGVSCAYVYFAVDPQRQSVTRRVGPEQAERMAQVIARALTAEIEGAGLPLV